MDYEVFLPDEDEDEEYYDEYCEDQWAKMSNSGFTFQDYDSCDMY